MSLKARYILIFFALFSLVYFFRFKAKLDLDLEDGVKVRISSSLTQEPILQGNYQIFKVKEIQIRTNRYPQYHYNDKLIITGTLNKKLINRFKTSYLLLNPEIVKLEDDKRKVAVERSMVSLIYRVRERLEKVVLNSLPEPQASLLIGIILGIQKSMPQDFYNALKTTGTLHIIVASGMNISLTAGLLGDFLSRFLKRKLALVVSLVCVFIYCVIAGLSPPIVRAGLMAGVLYLSTFLGRETVGLWLLLLVAGLMLLFQPLLLFDVGFQLSFAATAGLMSYGAFFERLFTKFPSVISSSLAETASAQILTMPILIISFGQFNPFSLVPNALVLSLVPFLMLYGMITMFIGLIFFPLAKVLSWLLWLPLTYFIKVIDFFGQFEFLNLKLENFSWIFIAGYYLIVLSFIKFKKIKIK